MKKNDEKIFGEISIKDAKDRVKNYLGHKNSIKLPENDNKILKGFKFSVTDLTNMTGQHNAESVYFALAHTTGDDNTGEYTLVMVGIDNQNRLMISKANGDKVYDLCDPCPDICAVNIEDLK